MSVVEEIEVQLINDGAGRAKCRLTGMVSPVFKIAFSSVQKFFLHRDVINKFIIDVILKTEEARPNTIDFNLWKAAKDVKQERGAKYGFS